MLLHTPQCPGRPPVENNPAPVSAGLRAKDPALVRPAHDSGEPFRSALRATGLPTGLLPGPVAMLLWKGHLSETQQSNCRLVGELIPEPRFSHLPAPSAPLFMNLGVTLGLPLGTLRTSEKQGASLSFAQSAEPSNLQGTELLPGCSPVAGSPREAWPQPHIPPFGHLGGVLSSHRMLSFWGHQNQEPLPSSLLEGPSHLLSPTGSIFHILLLLCSPAGQLSEASAGIQFFLFW